MATRKVYVDKKGPYFKGEGFIFRLPHNNFGSHVEVHSVSCGQSGGATRSLTTGILGLPWPR